MKRFLTALVVALSATATIPGWSDAHASDQPGMLTITASSRQHGVLNLKQSITIDAANWTRTLPAGTVSTTSPYTGVVISDGQSVIFGLYVDRELPFPLTFGKQHPQLRAGRYDVTVFSQSSVTLRLRITNSHARYALRLTKKASGTRTVAAAGAAPAAPVGYTSLPMSVSASSVNLLVLTTTSLADNASNETVCVSDQRLPCEFSSIYSGNSSDLRIVSTQTGTEELALFTYPGDLPAGPYYATADYETVGVQQVAQFVVVSF